MSLIANITGKVPQDGNGRPFSFKRAIRMFDVNGAPALELAVNAFLVTLETTPANAVVLDIQFAVGTGNARSAMVSYGYFVPDIY